MSEDLGVGTARDLTPAKVSVWFNPEGAVQRIHVGFVESGGTAFFNFENGLAKYDGHVHSVDREKAKEAVKNCPIVDEVSMVPPARETAQEGSSDA